MGLYQIQIREGMSDTVIETAKASGISFTRVNSDSHGTHYFFKSPRRSREISITLTKDQHGHEFLRMGVSSVYQALAKRIEDANLIVLFLPRESKK
jgi:hypothetical protein